MGQVLGKRIKYWCRLSSSHYIGIVEKEMCSKSPYVYKVRLLCNDADRYIAEGQIVKIYEEGEVIPDQHDGVNG